MSSRRLMGGAGPNGPERIGGAAPEATGLPQPPAAAPAKPVDLPTAGRDPNRGTAALNTQRGPGSDHGSRRPWLLIEDDAVDDVAFRRAAKQAGLTVPIVTTPTIDAAFDRLLQAPRPRLIVLDLNLPGRGGLDALSDLRRHGIPIVILTTSRDERDVARAHASGIAGFFAKPLDRQAYQDTVTLLVQYWNRAEVAP